MHATMIALLALWAQRGPLPLSSAAPRACRCNNRQAKSQTHKTRRQLVPAIDVRDSGVGLQAEQAQGCARAKPVTPILHRSVPARHIRNQMLIHPLALKSAA
jgi:hypothetical protein